ncbi:SDR family NAD(P)-dependent oxidoreductase [Phototrophicus methaneseepsis]|uniref:SDR family NAD(P)-dependent oxidoreductase n=1 Tax=Phototrophicus methaneseepsis TaxID=2710758 RepID=A0A7S8E718_9CHLR|nr:SDR family NAD(P)-dependent oxidoreductase [Phototrophicus methaneseepsis]QPC81532.1 SDR family NAD(P)-dependent oxidoreductase [Phototrophicus methaneseepsis]
MLTGKQVLVTGATGFLGGALVRRLSADGAQVRALARRPGRDDYIKDLTDVTTVMGDVTDPASLEEAMQGVEIVFHVAAMAWGPLKKQRVVNVTGTRNVAQAATEAGVKRLVHVSTVSVYGYRNQGRVTEKTPLHPGSPPYAHSKAEGEAALRAAVEKTHLDYAIVRPGMIYGPRSTSWTRGLFRLAKLRPTPWLGDGSGTAFPIYVDDVVSLMIAAATHPAAVGEAFNVTPDPSPTWREFLGYYQALAGHQGWVGLPLIRLVKIIAPLVDAILTLRGEPQDIGRLVDQMSKQTTYSNEKAKTLLGWEPQVSLAEGVQYCVPYLQEEGLLP